MSFRDPDGFQGTPGRWRHPTLAGLMLCGMLPALAGCGESTSPFVKVGGTVTLDGKPLSSGFVQFQPTSGQVASGEIGPDGGFVLSTHSAGDGVLPGTYGVTVVAYDPEASEQTPEHLIVPLRYTRSGASGLEVTVFHGSTTPVSIELVSDEAPTEPADGASPTAAGAAGESAVAR
jgi:hypothetical protein